VSVHAISLPCQPQPIALIGIGCRFPGGASDPEKFWQLLREGGDTVGDIPEDRWDVRGYYHPDPSQPGKMYSRRGSFLQDVDLFDTYFFHMSPREAAYVDPQQRLLLEVVWEALEDGGLAPSTLAGTATGVFMAVCTTDYSAIFRQDPSSIGLYSGTGGASSVAANRISYAFDFCGPSMAIDTACSSSLVAVHLACESLSRGESTLAIAGGVNLMFDPTINICFCKANMLSPRGRCSSFDAEADGFVRAEGAGVVALKPLSEAVADNDPIYAVIRATAVNQDGRTSGISQPNGVAQENLLRQVYSRAGILPRDVQYVEAHGTGTPIGDPIECGALGSVLGADQRAGDCVRIGSVKSNIGHLEAASGIAGFIKTALALKHRHIPRNIHFKTPNPRIPFDALRLRVQETDEPWPETSGPAIAGVNAFGFGGTNAHAVLEEFVTPVPATLVERVKPSRAAMLLPVSARSPQALSEYARAYLDVLDRTQSPHDLCFTASARREHHPYRMAVAGRTSEDLRESLEAFLAGERRPGLSAGEAPAGQPPKLAFVFCGNGPQWWGMGRELLAQEPVVQDEIARCDALLRPYTGWSLLEELQADEHRTRMARTEVAQPALFALQLGLVKLWRSWGVEPGAVIGHSVGEVAAACVAGILSIEDAVRVIFHRSRTQERTAGSGGMAAVGLSAAAARAALTPYRDQLSIASVNSPRSVTVSGDVDALERLARSLGEQQVFCRRLPLDYAFHSRHMDPVRQDLAVSLEGLKAAPAQVPLISTVTGRVSAGLDLEADYWWRNMRHPVEFSSAIQALIEDDFTVFLEIGPHPILGRYVTECLAAQDRKGWVLPSLYREKGEQATLMGSLGSLYTLGHSPDWDRLYPNGGECVRLPSYPWQKERHWHDSGPRARRRPTHPLLGYRLELPQVAFEGELDTQLLPYLEDHKVQGAIVFPAAGYLEMAFAAVGLEGGQWAVEEFEIHKPLVLSASQAPVVQASLSPEGTFKMYSRVGDEPGTWLLHASGQARRTQPSRRLPRLDLDEIRGRCPREVPKNAFYELAVRHGLSYGPAFRGVERAWAGEGEALSVIRLPPDFIPDTGDYVFFPATLDGCLQTILAALPADSPTYLPVGLKKLRLYQRPNGHLACHIQVAQCGTDYLKVDYTIADQDQEMVAEVTGLRLQAVNVHQDTQMSGISDHLYQERWLCTPLLLEHRRRSAWSMPSPSWLADLGRVIPEHKELSTKLGRARYYHEIRPALDDLCTAYIVNALHRLGWQPEAGDRVTVASLVEQLGIEAQHERLVARFLAMLEQDGVLRRVGTAWEVERVPDVTDPAPLWGELAVRASAYQAELLLLGRCGAQLPEVLTGTVDPLHLLFGERGAATVEHLYDTSPITRIYNTLMQAVVSKIVDALPEDRTLRILEIGAGTGGTTAHLLPWLDADRTEYVFTDVSEVFLQKAEQRCREFPFVRYATLDIEKDPTAQGFDAHAFDLVIASNVVHATADLRSTLRGVQQLLASEALFLLGELTSPPRMVFLIFGLLPGFWLFHDEDLRSSQALLPADRWIDLLEEVGFIEVASLTEDEAAPDQCILLARGPQVEQPEGSTFAPSKGRSWLILADNRGVGEQVARRLAAYGDRVVVAEQGTKYERCANHRFRLRPDDDEDMTQLFTTLRSEQVALTDIAHCWSLDAEADRWSAATLLSAHTASCLSVVHLTRRAVECASETAPRLWIVTGGAQPLHPERDSVSIAQSPLVGLRRVIFNEHPGLCCTLVDIGLVTAAPGTPRREQELERLVEELCFDDQEDEILLRGQERYVSRLARLPLDAPQHHNPGPEDGFRLQISAPGLLDSLSPRPSARQPPRAGEVEIEVHAAALNFKDIMHAMGLLPAESIEAGYAGRLCLGGECAGRIVAIGDGVGNLQVGDEVIAMGRDALSAYMTTEADAVVRKPPPLSFEEGATLLAVFLTAHYALHHLAKLRAGERVLIHHASGGVGLAAIQIVRAAGGEVFATAGSPEKREYLRMLGVEHVMDSRSLTFADEIMEITGGQGVHVVLNSLTGEGLRKSLAVLGRFGRFLEIGKRDFLDNSQLGLRPFEKCLSLHAIDIDQLMLVDRPLVASLLQEIRARVEDGTYYPLPHRTFPMSRVVEAFRYMQQARHIGKVVVSIREQNAAALPPTYAPAALRPDGTYLISGGLGGFGLAAARWMVERGARHIVLAGRRGAATPEARDAVAALREAGARVLVAQVDVSQDEQVRELIGTVRASFPILRGVIHAAMILEDHLVLQLNDELLTKALAPKVLGAWNLHEHTLGEPLDFFVLFSSITSVFGNAGQGNYVAANAFLDNFAAFRRARGLPALAINWGGIADVGYVAQQAERGDRLLRRAGIRPMSPSIALEAMGRLLQEGRVRATVADIDWAQVKSAIPASSPRWAGLLPTGGETGTPDEHADGFRERLIAASHDARMEVLTARLSDHLAHVLGTAVKTMDLDRPMIDVGLDSLMAMEVGMRIENDLGVRVSETQLLGTQRVVDLAAYLIEHLEASGR